MTKFNIHVYTLLFSAVCIVQCVGCSANPRSKFVTKIENDLAAAKQHLADEFEIETARVAVFDAVLTGMEESPYEGEATFEIVGTRNISFEDYSGPCRFQMVYNANYLYSKGGWTMTDYQFTSEFHDAYEATEKTKAAVHKSLDGKVKQTFEASDWPSYLSDAESE